MLKKLKSIINFFDYHKGDITLFFVVILFCYIPWRIIERFAIDWDSKIAIDNYSTIPVKIYIDDEFWVEVPNSTNIKTNSLKNKLFSLDEGEYNIKISSIDKSKNQEFKISVKDNNYYVINVFNSVVYDLGTARYRDSRRPSYTSMKSSENVNNESFIKVGNEKNNDIFMFMNPPKKTCKTCRSKDYIIRKNLLFY